MQAIYTSSIPLCSHTGFSLFPEGATMSLMDVVPNWQGKHWEYGPEFLMKSGTNAASGWRLFEQTEWPQEKQSAVTSNQHTRTDIQERKNTLPENKQQEKAEEREEQKTAVE